MGCTNSKGKKKDNPDQSAPPVQGGVKQGQGGDDKTKGLSNVGPEIFVSLKKGSFTNEYKLGELLGEGAFGSVRLVRHRQTGLTRAMKSIKKSNIIKEEEEKMFSEVNILKQLDHPNIVKLYELYQDDQNYYLITEYCNGGELFDKIKQMDSFSEKEAAEYMKQILSAIFYCHSKQIVHRDLKPENLLFDSKKADACLKVIDFGTSRKVDPSIKLTKRLGTPYYIAPEVLKKSYDEKCDIWSCGVILFILLCGYPPFNGNNEQDILNAVGEGKFNFDEVDWANVSQEAKTLITKMLQKDPKQRVTAEQAYNDPWIQKNTIKTSLNNKILSNLQSFHSTNKIRAAIMTFIATHIVTQQEKEDLLKTFKGLDNNGDGQLSRQELEEGYTKVFNDAVKAAEIVDQIFKEVDNNNSGKVDFTEFVMAAMQKEKFLSRQKIEQAFKMFDQDGNGFIEKNELQVIMGGTELDDQTWNEILNDCDTNKDGKISQNEFIELLVKKYN